MFEQALRSTAYDFCDQTDIIQTVESDAVNDGVADYPLTIPAQMLLTRVHLVMYGTRQLTLTPVTHVNDALALRGTVDDTDPDEGTPTVAYLQVPGGECLYLYPVPDRTDGTLLTVRAAFAPKRDATHLADALFNNWVEPIAAGAIASLMAMPNQPFSSVNGGFYMQRYMAGVANARAESRKGRTRSSVRVSPRDFRLV